MDNLVRGLHSALTLEDFVMGKLTFLAMTIVPYLLVSGCIAPPKETGFLEDYSAMTGQYDLDKVRIASGANFSDYHTLVISPFDATHLGPKSLDPADRDPIFGQLEANLRQIMASYFETVTLDERQLTSKSHVLNLKIAITELIPTDIKENLMPALGLGNATASIEGTFVDMETGEELASFADRKRGSLLTKKGLNAQKTFPKWSKLQYLYLFTEIWAESIENLVEENRGHST